jgi:hypothetical protein
MQSPPTRISLLVRVGGLCSTSRDFSRRHFYRVTYNLLLAVKTDEHIYHQQRLIVHDYLVR